MALAFDPGRMIFVIGIKKQKIKHPFISKRGAKNYFKASRKKYLLLFKKTQQQCGYAKSDDAAELGKLRKGH